MASFRFAGLATRPVGIIVTTKGELFKLSSMLEKHLEKALIKGIHSNKWEANSDICFQKYCDSLDCFVYHS